MISIFICVTVTLIALDLVVITYMLEKHVPHMPTKIIFSDHGMISAHIYIMFCSKLINGAAKYFKGIAIIAGVQNSAPRLTSV